MTYRIILNQACTNASIHHVCTFRLVNGSFLLVMCVAGIFLSGFLIFNILAKKIRLPGYKAIFILNVSISDLSMAIVGVVRALGIISEQFIGVREDYSTTVFCDLYTIVLNVFSNSLMTVLIPLTADRLIAVMFPANYPSLVTLRASYLMVALSWLPPLAIGVYDTVNYSLGLANMTYQREYHRSTYGRNEAFEGIVFLFVPFLVLFFLYCGILFVIIKNKIRLTRLLVTTSAIILTGVMVTVPEIVLATFYVEMPYEVAQVFTVTLYYANSVFNPVIYFCVNPRVKEQIGIKGSLERFRHSIVSRGGGRGGGEGRADLQRGDSRSRAETSETRSRKGREYSGSEGTCRVEQEGTCRVGQEGNCRVEQEGNLERTVQEQREVVGRSTRECRAEDTVDSGIGQEQSERGTKSLHSTPLNGRFNKIEGAGGGNVLWNGTKDHNGSAEIITFRTKVWEEGRKRSQSEPYGMTTRITDV